MRFDFCGNVDCPEWVLAEVALLNKVSAIKLKLICGQILKKIGQQPGFEPDKLSKLFRDQKFEAEESKVCIALIEFVLRQSAKHCINEKQLSKDLLQMGVAIENANTLVKHYTDQMENLQRALRSESMRVSSVQDVQYGVSYLMATSASGTVKVDMHNIKPLDITVQMSLEVGTNPNKSADQQSS